MLIPPQRAHLWRGLCTTLTLSARRRVLSYGIWCRQDCALIFHYMRKILFYTPPPPPARRCVTINQKMRRRPEAV